MYEGGKITEDIFFNVANWLPQETLLVLNDTKVIHARLLFRNENGAAIEVFLLEPLSPSVDLQLAMFEHGECRWRCFAGNAKKWRGEKLVRKFRAGETEGSLVATKEGMVEGDFVIHLQWEPSALSLAAVIEAAGDVPLPPYIKRPAENNEARQYQTIYAVQDGSVAAPTAGLHFTDHVFEELKKKNIAKVFTTLHVSAGTFLPVKSEVIKDHLMHHEQFVIRRDSVEQLLLARKNKRRIVAVGTTSLRTIESCYLLGKGIRHRKNFEIEQWEPYQDGAGNIPADAALQNLLDFMMEKKLYQLTAFTRLLIAPGYEFKLADGLLTNFHQPQSTLLLLVAAFIGGDWKKVYDYALKNNFRFLSYGDASLIWSNK